MTEKRRLGECLVADHKISPQDLEHALYIQTRRGQIGTKPLLGTLLMELWWITPQDLTVALGEQTVEFTRAGERQETQTG